MFVLCSSIHETLLPCNRVGSIYQPHGGGFLSIKPSSWKGNNDSCITVSAQSAHSLISTLGAQDYEAVLDLS